MNRIFQPQASRQLVLDFPVRDDRAVAEVADLTIGVAHRRDRRDRHTRGFQVRRMRDAKLLPLRAAVWPEPLSIVAVMSVRDARTIQGCRSCVDSIRSDEPCQG